MADRTSSPLAQVSDDLHGPRPSELTESSVGDTVELAKPVIEVRELVETFRSHRVIVDGWTEILCEAVGTMTAFERRHPGSLPTLARLVTELEVLLRIGWGDARLLEAVSVKLAELLPAVIPPDIPRPEDERTWVFSSP